jgi:hypothetical protein
MGEEQRRKPSLLTVATTVIWSFFGVRRRAAHESETVHLSPVQVLVAGVIGAAVFVLVLVALVRFIVTNAV